MLALIAGLVETSRRHAAPLVAALLLLSVIGGYFVARNISLDTNIDKLINPNLPWRQQERKLNQAFPQNADLLAVVIDARTVDEAQDASAALAARLAEQKTLFKSVRQPDGGRFFEQNGLLFLSQADVQIFADQIVAAQPLIGTLAADPSLRGVFDALDLAAQGAVRESDPPPQLEAAFNTAAAATEAALEGRLRNPSSTTASSNPEQAPPAPSMTPRSRSGSRRTAASACA
jgi:hypothetical protein